MSKATKAKKETHCVGEIRICDIRHELISIIEEMDKKIRKWEKDYFNLVEGYEQLELPFEDEEEE